LLLLYVWMFELFLFGQWGVGGQEGNEAMCRYMEVGNEVRTLGYRRARGIKGKGRELVVRLSGLGFRIDVFDAKYL
jgi:hypothetical protein